jgi:hypothetical protein
MSWACAASVRPSATGVRVRDYPITIDRLLDGLAELS